MNSAASFFISIGEGDAEVDYMNRNRTPDFYLRKIHGKFFEYTVKLFKGRIGME